VGPELLLDSCVYIDVVQGRTPDSVDRLLALRILNHSTIALAELTHRFGRLDPANAATRQTLARLRQAIDMIPPHRLEAPGPRAFAEAGMLAGVTARVTGETGGPARLMDALLLLQTREAGRVLLTRNIADFDRLQQLEPTSRVLYYR
jgi:predicted nucleic acid-binding protein